MCLFGKCTAKYFVSVGTCLLTSQSKPETIKSHPTILMEDAMSLLDVI